MKDWIRHFFIWFLPQNLDSFKRDLVGWNRMHSHGEPWVRLKNWINKIKILLIYRTVRSLNKETPGWLEKVSPALFFKKAKSSIETLSIGTNPLVREFENRCEAISIAHFWIFRLLHWLTKDQKTWFINCIFHFKWKAFDWNRDGNQTCKSWEIWTWTSKGVIKSSTFRTLVSSKFEGNEQFY